MKKIALWIVMTAGLISLSACSLTKEKVELSFDDAYKTYMSSQVKIDENTMENMLGILKGEWSSHSEAMIQTNNTVTGGVLHITSDAEQNQDSMISSGTSAFNVKVFGNGQEYKLDTSLSVFQLFSGSQLQQYLKVNNFDIDLGSGDMQAEMIKTMAQPVLGNWIAIDILDQMQAEQQNLLNTTDPMSEVKKMVTNIVKLPSMIKDQVILENLGKTSFEGKLAYAIKVKPEVIKVVIESMVKDTQFASGLNLSGIDTMNIKGLLVVNDTDEVDLLLNDFNGNIENKVLFTKDTIVFTHTSDEGVKIEVNLEKESNTAYALDFTVSFPEGKESGSKTDIKGVFDIVMDFEADTVVSEIEWEVRVVSKDLEQILGRDTLVVTLDAKGESVKVQGLQLVAPKSAVLFSQLMSDTFGMPYMQKHAQEYSQDMDAQNEKNRVDMQLHTK